MAKLTTTGWIPAQHGAWAMLAVPFAVGLSHTAAHRQLSWADAALGLTWLVGYFAYNALVLTIKSPAKRRHRYRSALLCYCAVAGVLGAATLLGLGLSLLWWAPLYAVLLGTSLWLASAGRERSLLSGVLTVLASCGLMAVLRFTASAPLTPPEIAIFLMVTSYFVGTVLHVKSLIRERKNPAAARNNLLYHVLLALAVAVSFYYGWLSWPWLLWAALLPLRSLWLPKKPRKPGVIGVIEIVLSVWLLVLTIAA